MCHGSEHWYHQRNYECMVAVMCHPSVHLYHQRNYECMVAVMCHPSVHLYHQRNYECMVAVMCHASVLWAASNSTVLSPILKTVNDNLLLSSIGSVFQRIDAVKWNVFLGKSKRKSGTSSSSMLGDHVVRSDVLCCNNSCNYGGYPVINVRCVSIAILYCMSCTTGRQ